MNRSLVRWTPSRDLFRTPISRLFDDSFNEFVGPISEDTAEPSHSLAVDIRESEEALHLLVDLPGLTKEEVELTLENRHLTIKAETPPIPEEERAKYHRLERRRGSFSRSFVLPSRVETTSVEATFDNGVLTIVLPKAPEAKAQRLEIK